MTFYFIEDIISPHKVSFYNELAKNDETEIWLIVWKETFSDRTKLGWVSPRVDPRINVLINPTQDQLIPHLRNSHGYYFFDGIIAVDFVKDAFQKAVRNGCKTFVISEPSDWQGISGVLRLIREKVRRWKIEKYIRGIFAIGKQGNWWFEKKIGYPRNKVFDWAYFIDDNKFETGQPSVSTDEFKILYVGRLESSKGVDRLLKLASVNSLSLCTITFIGSGSLEDLIKKEAATNSRIRFIGNVPNDRILASMSSYDLLVLPSVKKDGWGAVINEALCAGIPVLVSKMAGACYLATEETRGIVRSFDPEKENEWIENVHFFVSNKINRSEIQKWYYHHLSPGAAVDYFLSVVKFAETGRLGIKDGGARPIAPWLSSDN